MSKLRETVDKIKKEAFEAGFLAGWKAGLRDHTAEMREEAYLKYDHEVKAKLNRVTTSAEWQITSQSQTQ